MKILIDTVEGFVDNKKMLHIPDAAGQIVALPLTLDILHSLASVFSERSGTEALEFTIQLESKGHLTEMKLTVIDEIFLYELDLSEFDEL